MTFDDLPARVVVWGTGVEGTAAAALLAERGHDVVVVEEAAPGRDGGGSSREGVRPPDAGLLAGACVVRSPGVPARHPLLEEARSTGATVTTLTSLWLAGRAGRGVLGVTGTKGKSTTATLAHRLLVAGGHAADLVGNIGRPVTEVVGRNPGLVVVEISSFQAADLEVSPEAGVITSLGTDHLDWHGSRGDYVRDKLRMATAGPACRVAVDPVDIEAVSATEGMEGRAYYGSAGAVRVVAAGSGWGLEIDGAGTVRLEGFRARGVHNAHNLAAAVAGVERLTHRMPGADTVREVADAFEPLPSRAAEVLRDAGLIFVDDALASNPHAAAATLEAFDGRRIGLIVGGEDRGVDPAPLAAAAARHRGGLHVAALGPDAGRWEPVFPDAESFAVVGGLEAAVEAVCERLGDSGTVLFSPAAPTPSGRGGYRVRAAEFADAAHGVTGRR